MTLIERIEAATGPSRELDVAIFRVLKPEYAGDEWQLHGTGMRHRNDGSDMRCMPPIKATVPYYTASIDAALTLLPDSEKGETLRHAASAVAKKHALHMRTWKPEDGDYSSELAQAICVYALKARKAGEA